MHGTDDSGSERVTSHLLLRRAHAGENDSQPVGSKALLLHLYLPMQYSRNAGVCLSSLRMLRRSLVIALPRMCIMALAGGPSGAMGLAGKCFSIFLFFLASDTRASACRERKSPLGGLILYHILNAPNFEHLSYIT